jgi:VanZ family protein
MNAILHSRIITFSRTAAVLLTFCLFTVGSMPTAGQAFHGNMHWVAHLVTYAMIAFSFCLGWQQRPAVQIAAFVAAIGAIHEATEIITHSHGFETEDAIVNAIGALIGVAIQKTIQRVITR